MGQTLMIPTGFRVEGLGFRVYFNYSYQRKRKPKKFEIQLFATWLFLQKTGNPKKKFQGSTLCLIIPTEKETQKV